MSNDAKKPPEAPKAALAPDPRDLHTLHPILSDAEVRDAQKAARKLVDDERHTLARKTLIADERERLKQEEGLVVGGARDELVDLLIDLVEPEANSPLTVNGKPYHHGHTVRVPRHVADSLREMMWRLRAYTSRELKGETRNEFYRSQSNRTFSGRGMAA